MEKRDLDIICNSSVNWQMYRDKVCLITGATGRLGRYIIEALADIDIKYNLNMRIVGLARSRNKVETVFGNLIELPNVSFLYQNILAPIEYPGNIDYIFHTAGPAAPEDFKSIPVETLWGHVGGTHNILECARKYHTKRIFYISTVEIYGEWKEDRLIDELDMGPLQHFNYRACYPEAKRLCETMLASYKQEYEIDFCGVRLSHTLGPGILLDDGRAFAEFMQCAIEGKDIILHSDGSTMRTYTYVADAINAFFLVMEKGESIFYNVAAEENLISVRDLASLIASMSPSGKTKVVFGEDSKKLPYLPFKLAIMDTSRIQNLGWKPQTDIQHMFRWTMESFL